MTKRFKLFFFLLLCLGMVVALTVSMSAQTIISGDITGTVIDPSGAYVVNATVTLNSQESGASQSDKTNASGAFRFPLLRPGSYRIEVEAPGFAKYTATTAAVVGQVVSIPVKLTVGAAAQSVEVTGIAPLLQTESANLSTTYTPVEIESIPNPGGDLTNFALAAPGIVLSTGGGYGNFTAYGMPGTSNLYTINGGDMNDPYNNLNNSGSSNNMLGSNEVQEVAIVHNGYTGQYGRAASVNMNFTTKSGTNQFHGNAKWDWNGRYLNANDWFNNDTATPRPFANSNMWGASFGGPIVKNKLFFFADSEGMRYVLPSGGFPVYIPTTAFANAVTANILSTQPNEAALYQKMFQLYAGAPGSTGATSVTGDGGCGDLSGTSVSGVLFGTGGTPCTKTFRTQTNNLNIERLMGFRGDYNISDKDRLSARYWQDRGTQATFTDPINSAFNAISVQPQDAGQITETHIFNPKLINQFIVGGFSYGAVFGPTDIQASESVFPTEVGGNHLGGNNCRTWDGLLTCMGGEFSRYPNGRNVGQYQVVDDLSYTVGNHDLKFGTNYRRVNFSDFRPGQNQTGLFNVYSMTDFADGTLVNGSNVTQQFASATGYVRPHYHFNNYSLGLYAQDEWRTTAHLKLTASLRFDRNSNITCNQNCFSEFNNGFEAIDHSVTTAYNQSILSGQSKLFNNLQSLVWEPRLGFAYSRSNTVIRGGAGVFSDLYPAQVADLMIPNAPTVSVFLIDSGSVFGTGGAYEAAAAANTAFHNAFNNGGTYGSIKALLPTFQGPNYYSVVHNFNNPKYVEWNLEVQQSFGSKTMASLGYVGNHGMDLIVQQNGINAYCKTCPFGDLPSSAPDARFRRVRELTNNGISNYDGVTATFTRRMTKGLQGSLNYTWSHALDDISNGGIDGYSYQTAGESFLYQIDPYNLRRFNYGNADYDFRQNFSASYLYEVPYKPTNNRFLNQLLSGWSTSGVIYKRTAQPYSVIDSGLTNTVTGNNSGGYVMPYFLGGSLPNCQVNTGATPFQCLALDGSQFTETGQNTFGNVTRNHFRGPGYFNMDMTIKKNFRITESGFMLTMGANAYNVLNHPRFANPDNDYADVGSTFGQVLNSVTPASSPYGNFQGSAVSGRVLQLELEVKF
ncbi:MAG: carboxypeptidase regulatory-like domain-containing protein [Acidobacteriaceae bacterium]|nr:carboxypeptidase regulatory-like domain-containing protein [Acidobacteriaceae bacterium]